MSFKGNRDVFYEEFKWMIMIERFTSDLNYKEEDVWDKGYMWFLNWLDYFNMKDRADKEKRKEQEQRR